MKKLLKSFNYLVLIIIVFSFFLFSCKKNDNINTTNSNEKVEDEKIVATNTLVFGEERKKSNSNQNNISREKTFSEIDKTDIMGQLLPIVSKSIIPEDMVIGSLLDYNSQNLVSGTLPFLVVTFFNDMSKGVINKDILHPLFSEYIQKLYSSNINEQFTTIRIGNIIDKSGIVSANIRLFTNTGRVDGEVTADRFEGELLLSNISIDFVQLDEIYLRENLEYNPMNYSNLLLNY